MKNGVEAVEGVLVVKEGLLRLWVMLDEVSRDCLLKLQAFLLRYAVGSEIQEQSV